MNIYKSLAYILLLSFLPFSAFSQESDLVKKAENLQKSYRFEEAVSIYGTALSSVKDSSAILAIEEKIIQCENGMSLLKYATVPSVVARKGFPVADFYLNAPGLKNFSWIHTPNPLAKENHPYYSAIYFPEETKKLFFSAPDNSGSWNIYETDFIGGALWSEPKLLGEHITSSGDEIYPMLSADGKELYFASNGHYGMGGFDLYVSRWDDDLQEWGLPENLGFPYSSTADDIFFSNTPDGLYSILVSNRDCPADSVKMYVLDYVATPIKKSLSELPEINAVATLAPPAPAVSEKKETEQEEEGISEYSKLVAQMRVHQKDLNANLAKQKENRALYEKVENEDDKQFLSEMITDLEKEAIEIKSKLDAASKEVQKAEMDFLAKGIIPQIKDPAPVETKPAEVHVFEFPRVSFGEVRNMEIEKPVPKFDYSFKILNVARMAQDNKLPAGLVYQIQILVTSNKVTLKGLKGLSPVFENKQPSGKYLYTVGLFSSHSEALSCLNQVRKKGFPKAFIVAYNNGKSIGIKDARLLEKKIAAGDGSSFQLLLKNYPDGIPDPIISAIRESCNKDIAKSVIDRQTVYIVGPFPKKSDADYVKSILSGLGVEGVFVEPIKL